MKQYFGKYKARVTDLNDPERRGRIRVQCPSVLGEGKSPWCEVCSPVAYDGGGDFCLPKIGDTVWVEFEEGNPNKPIWVGSWWSIGKTPVSDYSSADSTRIIEYLGSKIQMSSRGITISSGGSTIEITDSGVYINGSTIHLN